MKHMNLNKVLSTSLSLALAVTSAPMPAGAVGPTASAPAFVATLTPPERFGYVASSYAPNGAERPRLVVIADLHGHLEVQNNIIGMLEHVVGKLSEGKDGMAPQAKMPIFVEGGWEGNLEHPLRAIQNSKARAILSEYFLRKYEIPATQAFSERHPDSNNITLIGVENKNEYEANRKVFARSYPLRKQVLEALARQEETVNDLSAQVEPGAFATLQKTRDAYLKGRVTGERYAKMLVRQAHSLGVTSAAIDILRHPATVSTGSFELALVDAHRLVSVKLSENRPLSAIFRKSYNNEDTVRKNLSIIDSHMDLLKRVLSNQLTPEEVPYAVSQIPALIQVAQTLLQNDAAGIDIEGALHQALAFYPFAFLRDKSLVKNSLAALDKMPESKTGILVVGGFHMAAISDELRKANIPYILLNPTITRDMTVGEQFNYVRRMGNEHVTSEEVVADFARPGYLKVLRQSDNATALMNGTPGSVTTGGVTDALGNVKDAADKEDKDKPTRSPGSGLASAGDTVLGVLGTELAKGRIVSRAAGIQLPSDLASIADSAARSRVLALADYVQSSGLPLEAKITDATDGATFELNDGIYVHRGTKNRVSDNWLPVINFDLHYIDEVGAAQGNQRAEHVPTRLHVQNVSGNIFLKYAMNLPKGQREKALKKGYFALAMDNDNDQFILANGDRNLDIQKGDAALNKLHNTDEELSDDEKKAVREEASAVHEALHPTTVYGQEGFIGEAYVERDAVGVMLAAGTRGGIAGVDHSATMGIGATNVTAKYVTRTLEALGSTFAPVNKKTGKLADEIKRELNDLESRGELTISRTIQLLHQRMDVAARRERAMASVAKYVENMPLLSDTQKPMVIARAATNIRLAIAAVTGDDEDLKKAADAEAAKMTTGNKSIDQV